MSVLANFWQRSILREMPWRWALWWLVLPNLAFMVMWPIGGPMMSASMLICGTIAIIAVQSESRIARAITLLMIFLVQLTLYVTSSFNIDFWNVMLLDQYLAELNPARSPEYVVAGAVVVIAIICSMCFGVRIEKMNNRNQFLGAFALVAMLVNADAAATFGTRGTYKTVAPDDAPVDSAILQTAISPRSVAADNLVVIMVESWGVPSNPFERALDEDIWALDRVASRYAVQRGVSTYYGSTTNAEVREWCSLWGDHMSTDFDKVDCLPERFRQAGFRTVAYHSFNDEFFDRGEWYPKIGFDVSHFDEDLLGRGARHCDGVFPGACDPDVPRIIAEDLRNSPSKRNLVYWLTLNAHLPVPPDETFGTQECSLGSREWSDAFPMLCRSYKVHQEVADSIVEQIMDPAFPEADLLIVGDHMPPFFQRTIRTRFDSAHVPWIYLENRAARRQAADPAAEVSQTYPGPSVG